MGPSILKLTLIFLVSLVVNEMEWTPFLFKSSSVEGYVVPVPIETDSDRLIAQGIFYNDNEVPDEDPTVFKLDPLEQEISNLNEEFEIARDQLSLNGDENEDENDQVTRVERDGQDDMDASASAQAPQGYDPQGNSPFEKTGQRINNLVGTITNVIGVQGGRVNKTLGNVNDKIVTRANGIQQTVFNIFQAKTRAIQKIVQKISNLFRSGLGIVSRIVNGLARGIQQLLGSAFNRSIQTGGLPPPSFPPPPGGPPAPPPPPPPSTH